MLKRQDRNNYYGVHRVLNTIMTFIMITEGVVKKPIALSLGDFALSIFWFCEKFDSN